MEEKNFFKGKICEFCGEAASNYLFATLICDSEVCIERARKNRGGPGGHLLDKCGGKCNI